MEKRKAAVLRVTGYYQSNNITRLIILVGEPRDAGLVSVPNRFILTFLTNGSFIFEDRIEDGKYFRN